jgi:hypothetical protein
VTYSVNTVITGTQGRIHAPSIQVRWKSGDFSPALSQGAKIAIGVVVPLVVLSILLGASLWLIAKKRTSRHNSGFLPPLPGTDEIEVSGPLPTHEPELEAKTNHPELDSSQYYPRSKSNGAMEFPLDWGIQKTPAAAEVDLNIPHSAVRSFSNSMPNSSDIPLPNPTTAYDIYRKPLADPSPFPAAAIEPLTTLPASPRSTILRPGILPSTSPTLSAPLPPPLSHSHSPLPSSEPSIASFPLDSTSQDTSNNLLALQRKYEKVREERERLNKLQELTELEERLRSQIEVQTSGGGDAGARGS